MKHILVIAALFIGSSSQAFIKFSTPKNPLAKTTKECSKCCGKTKIHSNQKTLKIM